jgi:glycosyltransferase involved in cell wall biosynthesis
MFDIKLSVIMPVYKVEQYVGRAIESILCQTLKEFEFIIVDDGSPDKSGSICDDFAKKDERIRVIHKENEGAPSARNIGIDIATGKYMYFIDSDDWAEPHMLKDMYDLAEIYEAQCVITGYHIDTYYGDDECSTLKISQLDAVYLDKNKFRKEAYRLFDSNLLYASWNKLYVTAYIQNNGFKFPDTFWDDFPFNLGVIRDIERVVVSSKQYYHFLRARAESETAKYISNMYEKREEEHQWLLDLYRYWRIDDENSREFLARRYIERLVGCIENTINKRCELSTKEKKSHVRRMIYGPNVDESMKAARPRTMMMKTVLVPIRLKLLWLVYMEGRIISHVKTRNLRLFSSLKAKR